MNKRLLPPVPYVPVVKKRIFQDEEYISFNKWDFMHNLCIDTSNRLVENCVVIEEWSGNKIYAIII